MTNEQREAIEYLKESVLIYKNTIPKISDSIDIVLSLIKEQQIYIKKYNDTTEEMNRDIRKLISEIQKKDRQIDFMAEYIEKVTVDLKVAFGENMLWNRNEIKQYFADLVEKE